MSSRLVEHTAKYLLIENISKPGSCLRDLSISEQNCRWFVNLYFPLCAEGREFPMIQIKGLKRKWVLYIVLIFNNNKTPGQNTNNKQLLQQKRIKVFPYLDIAQAPPWQGHYCSIFGLIMILRPDI